MFETVPREERHAAGKIRQQDGHVDGNYLTTSSLEERSFSSGKTFACQTLKRKREQLLAVILRQLSFRGSFYRV